MKSRDVFMVGSPAYDPSSPVVARALQCTERTLGRLSEDERKRVQAEIEAHSRDVEVRCMLARQRVDELRTQQKAKLYRQLLTAEGYTRVTMYVAKDQAREFRKLVLAYAQREGIRVKGATDVAKDGATTAPGARPDGGGPPAASAGR